MSFRVAYYIATFVTILTPVKDQPTIQGCENGDPSKNVFAELNVEAMHHLNEQLQSIRNLFAKSLREMKAQHDTVLRRLEAFNQRLDEHEISVNNQTQNSWKLIVAFGIDLGNGPIPLSTVNDWIVLMHRFEGYMNFNRNWTEYKYGFGGIGFDFWLGNEKIHRLTNRLVYTLRIEVQLKSNGKWYYADYATFSVDSEEKKFRLRLRRYSGTAGDSLTNISQPMYGYVDGTSFETWDVVNDRNRYNCRSAQAMGWWSNSCTCACLTGPYNTIQFRFCSLRDLSSDGQGLLQAARMMIKSI